MHAYVAASLAMFFTALSYARMAGLFPVAGSAYSHVRRSINDHLGFIAGWAVLLGYLFQPMDIWLIGMLATLWLMVGLDRLAIMLGCAWLVIGGLYLAWLTGGFRRRPPVLHFDPDG